MHILTRARAKFLRALRELPQVWLYKYGYGVRCGDPAMLALKQVIADITADLLGHYVSFSQDDTSKVSYARTPDDKYNSDRRVKTTLARYLRRHYTETLQDIPDAQLAHLCGHMFGVLTPAEGFVELVSGKAIVEAYDEEFGGDSCMTGSCSTYVELYALNPDKVQLIKYENGVCARALLWTADCGTKVMDRIYPNDGYHVPALLNWAARNGYAARSYQSAGRANTFTFGTGYAVTLQHTCEYWPYMDTFAYCKDLPSGAIRLSTHPRLGGYDCTLNFTDGSRGDTNRCTSCDELVSDDEACTYCDEIYCNSCYCENYSCCEHCGETYPAETVMVLETSRHEVFVCGDCAANITDLCPDCEGTYHESLLTEGWDGEHRCETCNENLEPEPEPETEGAESGE